MASSQCLCMLYFQIPSVQAKRIGPLAVIICTTQARSVEIAKRCLSFSPADSSISVSNENYQFLVSISLSHQIHGIQFIKSLIV